MNKLVGDCVVRAIAKLMNRDWESVYMDICFNGLRLYDMPSANHVWEDYLSRNGFKRYLLPDTCPHCYTVSDFCIDFPEGEYLLAIGNHVVTVIDGNYYDTWDSGGEIPVYYWRKEN